MKKKIFSSVFISSAAILLACLIIILGVLFEYFGSVQKNQLADLCGVVAGGIEKYGTEYLDSYDSDCRITLISGDGTVLYDSVTDISKMTNHFDREEIAEALKAGVGESERYSDTVLEKTVYYAKRLSDGSVVRASVTSSSVLSLLLGMMQYICVILFVALIFALVVAERISTRIVSPLNSINLEKPLENKTYEEITPLLGRIEHLRRGIDRQVALLKQQQDEFSAVTDGMSEGLVLLGNDNVVLSINRAAAELFGAGESSVGNSFLTVCRSTSVQSAIEKATEGNRGETELNISGREYLLSAAPVFDNEKVNGICLLAVDVTEKVQAEQMRREFTANVSHELKTPLHSIMGTAELLKNGLVKEEDVPHFTDMIMTEASRLVRLVNDIIRLSQLDEAQNLSAENVDLLEIAREAADVLSESAKKNEVDIIIHGESVKIEGVRTLLYEIIYNLCDNAIRYNVKGGKVDVFIENIDNIARIRVSDTGIGIPAEHQSRIFERFYRVDKSRSRECGGTGLGLSIVKHAAEYHHAKLMLKSTEGKGTEIGVVFGAAE